MTNTPAPLDPPLHSERLLSMDFMRGLIMVLLMLESTGLYDHLMEEVEGTPFSYVMMQFFHHPWNGLRFWDLIQPGFMFIAGAALAWSLHRQQLSGVTWRASFFKVLKRSAWLFALGVLSYAVRRDGLSFELWNVLTQLSVTTLIAFLIFRWSAKAQIVFSFGLLLLIEVLFRFSNIEGYNQPFEMAKNFGSYVDLLLMNKLSDGGWVAINCIPTACHTIWGALAGKLLFSTRAPGEKVKYLLIAGVIGLVAGYTMDLTITPIIKRIATSSFTLASGGWCLLCLGFLYWWIDVKRHRKYLLFFTVVGMNSIFIYLFIEIVAHRWFNGYVNAIVMGLLQNTELQLSVSAIIASLIIFSLEWALCWYLYTKKVFIKL